MVLASMVALSLFATPSDCSVDYESPFELKRTELRVIVRRQPKQKARPAQTR